MPESNPILYDLNKVFIPCRTVLEMEALTSLFLEYYNYDEIKELPQSQPTSEKLIDKFHVLDCEPLEHIIEYFIEVIVSKLKPIVMYERNHHDRFRMGNVDAYAKTRLCLFFALHRLKLKFLVIKNFMDKFKGNNYRLDTSENQESLGAHSFLSAFYQDYHKKNKMNLKLMLSSKRMSDRVSELMDTSKTITNEDIINAITFRKFLDDKNRIKFIMKEIKASLFVCRVMFAQMDVGKPFTTANEMDVDAEEMMISQDFIPELIPAISQYYAERQMPQLEDCFRAYDFMMHRALEGINHAVELASGGQIVLDLDSTIYNTGNIFAI
ncbi:MAG: hypothetical protein ACFFCE_13525 [Promethearchaeota archaeon]